MKRIPLMLVMALLSLTAAAQSVVPFSRPVHPRVVAKAPAKVAEQRNEDGIIITPASGVEKTFKREGKVLTLSGFDTNEGFQYGESKFVFCEDGTVYWNHPLCDALEATRLDILTDTWVKGTLDGETITFPAGQKISTRSTPPFSQYVLYMCDLDETSTPPDAVPVKDEPIVLELTRGGKVMTLKNSSRTHMMGGFNASSGYSISAHWDYDLTFIQDTSDEHAPAVTLPAGVTAKDYVIGNHDVKLNYNGALRGKIAINGNDAYLGNFSFYGKGCWLKGTKQADGSLVFPKGQFISNTILDNSGIGYDLYVYGIAKGKQNVTDLCDLVYNYDATTGRYVAAQDLIVNIEEVNNAIDYAERLTDIICYDYPLLNDEPIYTVPGGYRVVTYDCHGQLLNANDGGWWAAGQEGLQMKVAWAPDGKNVLMNGPLTWVLPDSWIKGTVEADGKLHVPTMQMVQNDEDMGQMWTGVFRYQPVDYSYTYYPAPDIQEVVFDIDNEDGYLSLQPFSADEVEGKTPSMYIYGFYAGSDEFLWRGLGDAYTVYTPVEGSEYISGDEPGDEPGTGPDDDAIDISKLCSGEVRNEYGIITTPGKGTEYTFNRSGSNYAYVNGDIDEGTQSGILHLVETTDGYVFMQKPLSTYSKAYAANSWIKGVKRENEYIFPEGQPINYDAFYDANLVVCMGEYDSTDGTFIPNHKQNIVFAISEDSKTLTLQNTTNAKPVALFYADDDAWVGYGDYRTVLTFNSEGLVEEKTEPSWKAKKLNYILAGFDREEGFKGYNAVLAFEDDDVFLANFSFWTDYYHEDSHKYVWIKGKKRADGSLYFPREQFLYTLDQAGQSYDLFFYGVTETISGGGFSPCDLIFTYNEATKTYEAQQEILLTWGRITTSLPRAEQIEKAKLYEDPDNGSMPFIIKDRPEGNLFTFARSGFAFSNSGGMIYQDRQDGDEIEMVFTLDGRYVFMHNPVSKAAGSGSPFDAWVSGIVDSNNNLYIPMEQLLGYNTDYEDGLRTGACVLVEDGQSKAYRYTNSIQAMTFSFDPYNISFKLDRIDGINYNNADEPRLIYGCFWTNDYEWAGVGDFDSVYTPLFDTTDFDGFASSTGITSTTAPVRTSNTYYDFAGRQTRATKGSMVIKDGKKMLIVK